MGANNPIVFVIPGTQRESSACRPDIRTQSHQQPPAPADVVDIGHPEILASQGVLMRENPPANVAREKHQPMQKARCARGEK